MYLVSLTKELLLGLTKARKGLIFTPIQLFIVLNI